ncbi:MAG: enhanced serine sensitivity protein SseB C-terminal domain-containing protein [Oscillospiraceae bacterium]|nr:enhanced serine sensitivity protein SseB C-terminal domain-containing protein [Oscillospiraceae bacterium]MBQ9982906.1 enhanced serine sensitivity protein SseB C-terminal domain-containing protein [Oscillospiraceae bacterium]
MEDNKNQEFTPVVNPALVKAMEELKEQKSKDAEKNFIVQLRQARLLSPAIIEVKDENGDFVPAVEGKADPKNTRVNFMMLSQKDGQKFLPAFTSIEEVRKWRKEEKLQNVVSTFEQYLAMITADENGPNGFVIDPFGSNIIMPRELLVKLKEAADKFRNEQVMVGELKDYPDKLAEKLISFFEEKGNVEKAFLLAMTRGTAQGYLVVVDYDGAENDTPEQSRSFYDEIAEAVNGCLDGKGLSIASVKDSFGSKASDNRLPFYTR